MAEYCTCNLLSNLGDSAKSSMTQSSSNCETGTPLLDREDDHAMTGFWSPKRPPNAPLSSPKLNPRYTSSRTEHCSSSHARTLAYLNQQLHIEGSEDVFAHWQVPNHDRSFQRFSWDTAWSSDDDYTGADDSAQQCQSSDHDGATLVQVPSAACSSSSEAYTMCGDSVDDTDPRSAYWKPSIPSFAYDHAKSWSSTVPIRGPNFKRANIILESALAKAHVPEKRTSCPAQLVPSKAVSTPMIRSESIDQSMSVPLPPPDENRSQPRPSEQLEKSSWDPDSSDEEKGGSDRGARQIRRRFGRKLSNTLKPLLCRS